MIFTKVGDGGRGGAQEYREGRKKEKFTVITGLRSVLYIRLGGAGAASSSAIATTDSSFRQRLPSGGSLPLLKIFFAPGQNEVMKAPNLEISSCERRFAPNSNGCILTVPS